VPASAGRAAEIEALRIVREYRRLVLLGRLKPRLAEAQRLVGPDCAFHLYFRHAPPAAVFPAPPGGRRRKRRTPPRR
jgi:hypothetical protein